MRVSYSTDADVLYLTFVEQRTGAAYIENENGDIFRIDSSSGQILGVTIQLFQHRMKQGEIIDIPEVGLVATNPSLEALLESSLVKK